MKGVASILLVYQFLPFDSVHISGFHAEFDFM